MRIENHIKKEIPINKLKKHLIFLNKKGRINLNDFLTLFKDYKKKLYMILSFLLIYTILQVLTPILIGWAIGLIGENSIKNNLSANKFSITMIFISITLLMSFILNSY